MNMPSLAITKYILTFIVDLSRSTWVYFLKNKSHFFEKFMEFRALAENQCGRTINCLRSNNGREHVRRQFEEYLSKSGISW